MRMDGICVAATVRWCFGQPPEFNGIVLLQPVGDVLSAFHVPVFIVIFVFASLRCGTYSPGCRACLSFTFRVQRVLIAIGRIVFFISFRLCKYH